MQSFRIPAPLISPKAKTSNAGIDIDVEPQDALYDARIFFCQTLLMVSWSLFTHFITVTSRSRILADAMICFHSGSRRSQQYVPGSPGSPHLRLQPAVTLVSVSCQAVPVHCAVHGGQECVSAANLSVGKGAERLFRWRPVCCDIGNHRQATSGGRRVQVRSCGKCRIQTMNRALPGAGMAREPQWDNGCELVS